MSRLQSLFRRISNTQKEKIEKFLSFWLKDSIGIYIVPNIEREPFLNQNSFDEIINELLNNSTDRANEIAKNYRDKCYKFICDGEPVKDRPVYLQRAVFKSHFDKYLRNKCNIGKRNVDYIINLLGTGKSIPDEYKPIPIAFKNAWVTWSNTNDANNPFSFARTPQKGIKICASLGLTPIIKGETLLVFVFKYDANHLLKIPTIADAGLHCYFQVASVNATSGTTRPWQEEFLNFYGIDRFKPIPLPEAVQKPQTLKDIVFSTFIS